MQRAKGINFIWVEPPAGESPFAKKAWISENVMDEENLLVLDQHGANRVRPLGFSIFDLGLPVRRAWILRLH